MLEAALSEMENGAGLVTFNGRGFDVPILQARAALRLRRFDSLTQPPHWDLLPHARRLWKRRLESCALRSLETEVLGVRRSTEDVPSSMIPWLYREYLRTGDPRCIAGVLYHNVQDILSMAFLAARILDRYTRPFAEIEDPRDVLSLAFVHRALGRFDLAEAAFRAAAEAGLDRENRVRAWEGLAGVLKDKGASAEAVEFWEAWHASAPDDPRPSIELAKYFEWRMNDLPAAMIWAERAGSAAAHLPAGARTRDVERAVAHRLNRLNRKQKSMSRKPPAHASRS
jgi:tetratricopeptide (TPR) repeat protein